MQRHKMNHSFGQQGGQQGCECEEYAIRQLHQPIDQTVGPTDHGVLAGRVETAATCGTLC